MNIPWKHIFKMCVFEDGGKESHFSTHIKDNYIRTYFVGLLSKMLYIHKVRCTGYKDF